MIEIETYKEMYIINIENILYINIYEDNAENMTIDIRIKESQNIILDENDLDRKKIINIANKLKNMIGLINL